MNKVDEFLAHFERIVAHLLSKSKNTIPIKRIHIKDGTLSTNSVEKSFFTCEKAENRKVHRDLKPPSSSIFDLL